MGLTKSEIFTKEQNYLASIAKVLAHPARIAIIHELIKMESCVCGDLVAEIGLAQATISQHLKELKAIELIQGTIDGTSVCYCINSKKWEELQNQFTAFFELPKDKKSNCCN